MTASTTLASICAVVVGLLAGTAFAVNIETVPVGNVGNEGDWSGESYGGWGPDHLCGRVPYPYNIGKYEVTAGQYTEFLNKVAATDTYGLYNPSMWSSSFGCKIQRSGTSGSYTYSVAPDWADRPVNYVSWGDAARFANWLHNGQPTGAQGLATTETGAYALNGAVTETDLAIITRNADWTWAIPTEDEWYKAAYHKNDGITGNYWDYPIGSDTAPNNQLIDPDPGSTATYWKDGYTIEGPYWRTEVGAHENSASPYGTFDQGGNVWEWNDSLLYAPYRSTRGGAYQLYSGGLHAAVRNGSTTTYEHYLIGFRVVSVIRDSDADGVNDSDDRCLNTIPGIEVDADGCPPLILGDFDRDGDVDAVDVGAFAVCGSGPAVAFLAGCEAMDFDADDDVDQEDFGIFQACISGESVPGDPDCFPPPGMVLIPAGEFQMGNSFSGEGATDELPRHTVYVSAFHMDRYEVTKRRYCDALNWAKGQGLIYVSGGIVYGTGNDRIYCDTTTSSSYSGIQYTNGAFSIEPGRADHPMVMVSWYGAAAYTNWRSQREGREPCYTLSGEWTCDFSKNGYRLPTEAEWEKAARGGAAGQRFPWGNPINHDHADYRACSSCYPYDTSLYTSLYTFHPTFNTGVFPYTSPVGYFAPNDSGLYDMAGNVWEWCNDRYSETYYSGSPSDNPRGPTSGSYRVLRGGSWTDLANYCRVAFRLYDVPGDRVNRHGFRVALGAP